MSHVIAPACKSAAKRTLLVIVVLFATLAILVEVLAGYGFIYEEFVPGPPVWPAVVLLLAAGIAGPVAAVLQWRSARRDELALQEAVVSTASIGGIIAMGGLIVLLFIWAFAFAFAGT